MKLGLMQQKDQRTMTVVVYDDSGRPLFALSSEDACIILKRDYDKAKEENVQRQSVATQA
jgi:hypothetical protein